MRPKLGKQDREIRIESIIQMAVPTISRYFGVEEHRILLNGRGSAREAAARGFLMFLLFKYCNFSVSDIGRAMGRCTATVASNIEKAELNMALHHESGKRLSELASRALAFSTLA